MLSDMLASVSLNIDKTFSIVRLALDPLTKHTQTQTKPDLSFPIQSVANEERLYCSPILSLLIYFYKAGERGGED